MTTAGVVPLSGSEQDTRPVLRVGMVFDSFDTIPEDIDGNSRAGWLDAIERVVSGSHLHDGWWPSSSGPVRLPVTLLYIPSDYLGPVDNGPEIDAAGTEPDAGVSVPDDSEPTMRGYIDRPSQRLHPFVGAGTDRCWCGLKEGVRVHATYEQRTAAERARSMANHPAGKAREGRK